MLLVVGYMGTSAGEQHANTGLLVEKLKPYLDDPVVRGVNSDAYVIQTYGGPVLDILSRGALASEVEKYNIVALQHYLSAMITRALVLKLNGAPYRAIGYCSGEQAALLATGLVDQEEYPTDMRQFSRDMLRPLFDNLSKGISACLVDFRDTDADEAQAVGIASVAADDRIFVSDRRGDQVFDFTGPTKDLESFLKVLDGRYGTAVRASRLRRDGGNHTPILSDGTTPVDYDRAVWERIRRRFAEGRVRFGTSIGHWWSSDSSIETLRALYFRTAIDPLESGRMARMVWEASGDGVKYVGSPVVVREMFAGTGFRPAPEDIFDVSWL